MNGSKTVARAVRVGKPMARGSSVGGFSHPEGRIALI